MFSYRNEQEQWQYGRNPTNKNSMRNKSDQNVEENCKYDSFYEREGNPYIRFN